MRSHKLLIVSATMLASTTLASLSFADNTPTPTPTPTPPATTGTSTSSSSVTSSPVMTPSAPRVPTTSTTITTQGTTPAPGATTPTSTTTTTSAEDMSAAAATPTLTTEPPRESVTLYQHQRPSKALLITGGSLLVSTYATTAALAAANGPIGDKDLYIPVAGPWINLANRSCSGDCPNETRDTVLIAGSGVLQGIGALMVVTSFFVPEKVPAARISAGNVKMQITPSAGPSGGGLGATGTF